MIFHSKDGKDEYINMLAHSHGQQPVADSKFDYDSSDEPIVLRGILKHKIMKRCWDDKRDFYYIDTGYFGNGRWKQWHRIVKNNLQLTDIQPRPGDRWEKHGIKFQPWQHGRNIVVAAPDEKPCKFYNIDLNQWIEQTVATIQQHTDRPVVVRQRAPKRIDRLTTDTLAEALSDAHALVTFNSNAATESVLLGVPVFTLAPNAAGPVGLQDLSQIETPYYPNHDELYAWASSLAYGQVHVEEMKNGSALKIIQGIQ
jgi:hypothetical protein